MQLFWHLTVCKQKTFLVLNWFVWSRTVWLNWIVFYLHSVSMSKTVLFQTIQFSISTQFSSIRHIDRNLSGATTPSQSGPGSDGNKGVLRIPQIYCITGASPSDCLVSWQRTLDIGVLPFCRNAVSELCSLSRLCKWILWWGSSSWVLWGVESHPRWHCYQVQSDS